MLGPVLEGAFEAADVATPAPPASPTTPAEVPGPGDPTKARDVLQRAMTEGAGVVRSAASLAAARHTVDALSAPVGAAAPSVATGELANLATAARALLDAATVRTESRGAHSRADFPGTDDRWRRRIVHVGGRVAVLAGSGGDARRTGDDADP